METVNKPFFDKEMIMGMFGAIWANLRRVLTILSFLGLIALNIATLTLSTVHDFLYKGLSSIPFASMADLLVNSPTEKNKRMAKKLEIEKRKVASNKLKVKNASKSIARRTQKIVAVNIGSIFTEALPYIGIATIIGVTTYEVKAACKNMKEMDALLMSLEIEDNNDETKYICGQEIPGEDKIRKSILDSKNKYIDFQNNLGGLLNETKEKSKQAWESFSNALGGTIDEMVH